MPMLSLVPTYQVWGGERLDEKWEGWNKYTLGFLGNYTIDKRILI